MINIDRINQITSEKRAEYIECLRDFNESFKETELIALESIKYGDVLDNFSSMSQIGVEAFDLVPVGSSAVAATAGVAKKSIKGIAIAAVAAVALIGFVTRTMVKFYSFGEKAKRVFKKYEEVIVPGKDSIDPDAFKSGKAKLLKIEQYQTLFKTTGNVTKLIKSFVSNYTTKAIEWKAEQFDGMTFVTKTNKEGESVIKDIKIAKEFVTTKITIGDAGWDLEKAFKLGPVIKAVIETTMEFKRLGETFKAEEAKLKSLQKVNKKNPEELAKIVAQLTLIKKNLTDFNHVLNAYFQLISIVCGQFFTLTTHMKVKKA